MPVIVKLIPGRLLLSCINQWFVATLDRCSPCSRAQHFSQLGDSNQQPFTYWPDMLTTRLPATLLVRIKLLHVDSWNIWTLSWQVTDKSLKMT